ncbi:MAG: NAD(P) transhydrogenase subunit alpha [Bacteroidetes bacterium]|nr:MAG: NAD(P) transhydrogenase subunit alpha [Bacteroidota bacterium]
MTIGVLKETGPETRVSLLPEHVAQLTKKGHKVLIELGAGAKAFANDAQYASAGGQVVEQAEIFAQAQLIFAMHLQGQASWPAAVFVGNYQPLFAAQAMQQLANRQVTTFSLDLLPRTTRGQAMDILSSQANIAGYKAVLLAATLLPRYFPMLMTAAGSIAPAKLLILGAGVAGLQAIATAKRLGAVVEVFDTRPAVKEEVQSLGAKFVEVEGAADASKAGGYAVEQTEEFKQRQQQKISDSAAKADVIITTAAIPGKQAPILITTAMLERMRPGSVIIDLAAATGGNTSLTQNDQTVVHNGVNIVSGSHLAATTPADASKLYGKNLLNFLELITHKEGHLNLNFDDDLVKGCCITHGGQVVHERVAALLKSPSAQ